MTKNINTKTEITWCPGCYNFQILAGVKNFFIKELEKGKKSRDFAICSGIGCHGKMFDYINFNGINTLHGREIPTMLGMKIGNPNLDVYGFSGDGATYSEGISHLIHACKENIDMTLIVHNNQVFALTVGQPTAVTEEGFIDKTTPAGVKSKPLNPLKLALSSNCSFVARIFADVKQVEWILGEAKKHRGFKFIEIIQPCTIFHGDAGYKEKTYMLQKTKHNINDWEKAMKKASEWDYNSVDSKSKLPLGIFYKERRKTVMEGNTILSDLVKEKKSWKNIRR